MIVQHHFPWARKFLLELVLIWIGMSLQHKDLPCDHFGESVIVHIKVSFITTTNVLKATQIQAFYLLANLTMLPTFKRTLWPMDSRPYCWTFITDNSLMLSLILHEVVVVLINITGRASPRKLSEFSPEVVKTFKLSTARWCADVLSLFTL